MAKTILEKRKRFKIMLLEKLTPAEQKLHTFLKDNNIKHEIQYIISPYIVDFYIRQKGLVIELDGQIHKRVKSQITDSRRDQYLFSCGLIVLRCENSISFDKILKDIISCRDKNHYEFLVIAQRIALANSMYGNIGYRQKSIKIDNPSHIGQVKWGSKKQLKKEENINKIAERKLKYNTNQ